MISHWLSEFLVVLASTCQDIAPIALIILGFQWLVIRQPLPKPFKMLIGLGYVIVGMSFFLQGLEMALFPLGKLMATQLTSPAFIGEVANAEGVIWQAYAWVYVFAAAIGFATTLAEPSLLAVALKAQQLSGGAIRAWGLRLAVSFGVAFGIALGAFRIVSGLNMYYFIIGGYLLVLLQTMTAPRVIIGLAYDSGGVTTSTVTVPLVTALGIGLATNVPGRNPLVDGFGLIAFASLFSINAVLFYAQLAEWWSKR